VGIETHPKLYLNYHLEGNKLDLGERGIVGGGRIQVDKGGWRVRCREFPEILPRTFRELSEDCVVHFGTTRHVTPTLHHL